MYENYVVHATQTYSANDGKESLGGRGLGKRIYGSPIALEKVNPIDNSVYYELEYRQIAQEALPDFWLFMKQRTASLEGQPTPPISTAQSHSNGVSKTNDPPSPTQ